MIIAVQVQEAGSTDVNLRNITRYFAPNLPLLLLSCRNRGQGAEIQYTDNFSYKSKNRSVWNNYIQHDQIFNSTMNSQQKQSFRRNGSSVGCPTIYGGFGGFLFVHEGAMPPGLVRRRSVPHLRNLAKADSARWVVGSDIEHPQW